MSLVITYHSLAIDCDSPSDLQRSPGVMVGREVCGKEGGGHGPSDTGLQVSLVVSSSMVHIREFGPWSVSRGILEVTETSPFGLLTFCPLTSLVPQLNHGLSHSESVVSLCHPLVCMNGCVFLSGVECTVQWHSTGSMFLLLGIILFGYCCSDFLFSSLFLFPIFSV